MLELAFRPDRSQREPLYRQLAGYLRDLIETGRLAEGQKLPATRELSIALDLGRNTVSQAYEILVDDGLLRSHVGQGTFVTGPVGNGAPPDAGAAGAPAPFAWDGLVSAGARALASSPSVLGRRGERFPARLDFRVGRIDRETLPISELRRAWSRALGELEGLTEIFADPYGWPPLREAVARSLVARGIRCEPDDVAIVNGAQQAIDLAARVLLDPGDCAVLEQPGYFGAALGFAAAQAQLVGVPVDEHGLRVDQLERVLRARRVKLVFTTPAVQAPTGVVLSDARRDELLRIADVHQVPVFEDDYDSELRYEGPVRPALKTLDASGQVIYAGTFSKVLFMGMRLGYVVAPRPLLRRFALARFATDFGSGVVAQAALTELITAGILERHVRRMRRSYTRRLDTMLRSLADHMPEGTVVVPPAGGSGVWVTLPPSVEPSALQAAAREAEVVYNSGEAFYLDGRGADQLALSYGGLGADEIEEGIARLGALARAAAAGSGSARRMSAGA